MKNIVSLLFVGVFLHQVHAQELLQGATTNLSQAIKSLREIRQGNEPIKLPKSYTVKVDYNISPQELVRLGKYKEVDPEVITNLLPGRTGQAEVKLVFIQYTNATSPDFMFEDLKHRNLRPAEPFELLTFAEQYSNEAGVFWIDTPVGSAHGPLGNYSVISVVNDNGRKLSYSPCMFIFTQPFYWVACVHE